MSDDSANEMQVVLALAIDYHNADDVENASRLYMKVLEQEPTNAVALGMSGLLCLQNGQVEAALDFLQSATAADPTEPQHLNHLGAALVQVGQLDDALSALRQSVAINEDYFEAHFNLVSLLIRASDSP